MARDPNDESTPDLVRRAADEFSLAGEGVRVEILLLLLERGEAPLSDVHGAVACQPATTNRHLLLLSTGGLVGRRRAGRRKIYSLTDRGRAVAAAVRGLGMIEREW